MKKTWIVLTLVLVGCAAPKPPVFKPMPQIHKLTLALPVAPAVIVPPPFQVVIPWQYIANSNRYCWTLQTSTNLVQWEDILDPSLPVPTAFPTNCLTGFISVRATNAFRYFRLKGTLP